MNRLRFSFRNELSGPVIFGSSAKLFLGQLVA